MTKLILRRRSAGSLLLVFGLAVAALKTARIDLPADFEATAERISIAGFGGHNKGMPPQDLLNSTVLRHVMIFLLP
jgi:hypothetical protein